MLKEKMLKQEIKMYLVGNIFRIYGKTFDVKEELKQAGAKWNSKNQRLEMSKEDFEKLDLEIQNKVLGLIEEQKQISLENISNMLLTGKIKVYLNKAGEYKIYGKTKEIFRDLQNVGFELSDNNYTINEEEFKKLFPSNVKMFVNEYQNNKQTEETSEEIEEYIGEF